MLAPLLCGISALLLLGTLMARLPSKWWWIRCLEFPRLQIASVALLFGVLALLLSPPGHWRTASIVLGLATLALQSRYILPWTRLGKFQVRDSQERVAERELTLLVANVLMDNRQADGLKRMIEREDPDIVLTLESDAWWEKELDEVLDEKWPHSAKVPLDNLYGMHLYSRYPLADCEVRWLIQDDIPSVHARVQLPSEEWITFYALHPRPPAPGESEKSLWRDAELLLVAKEIDKNGGPTLVAGDLNDVAWSRTTRLFARTSGMLDPRRGRGMFSTFHAEHRLARWPLDHIFVSEHFTLGDMRRLEAFGSDHFPILARLQYRPAEQNVVETPSATAEEQHEASETIAEGKREEQKT